MDTQKTPINPQPDLSRGNIGYDHHHWAVYEPKGVDWLRGNCGTISGGNPELVGTWEYLARGRRGMHDVIYGPMTCPFGHTNETQNVWIEWDKDSKQWVWVVEKLAVSVDIGAASH